MMTRTYINRTALLLGMAFSLQGCAALFGPHRPARVASTTPAVPTPVRDENTQRGRKLLTDGRVAEAIDAFREALISNENVAPAVNGLGVAYARLGRDDLARRYFSEAIVLDPVDGRYLTNLARLDQQRSPALPASTLASDASQPSKDEASANSDPVPGRLRRTSSYEVRIATISARARPIYSPTQRLLASTSRATSVVTLGTAVAARTLRPVVETSVTGGRSRTMYVSSSAAPVKRRSLRPIDRAWVPWNPLSLPVLASSVSTRGNIAVASSNQ